MVETEELRLGLIYSGKWEDVSNGPIIGVYHSNACDEPITGYLGQWYSGKDRFRGVRVESDKIFVAKLNSVVHGVSIRAKALLGINMHEKFYDSSCFLFNGSLGMYFVRKENFGDKSTAHLEPIKVSESMPLLILSILAEKEEKVIETARKLGLPLEAVVNS